LDKGGGDHDPRRPGDQGREGDEREFLTNEKRGGKGTLTSHEVGEHYNYGNRERGKQDARVTLTGKGEKQLFILLRGNSLGGEEIIYQ